MRSPWYLLLRIWIIEDEVLDERSTGGLHYEIDNPYVVQLSHNASPFLFRYCHYTAALNLMQAQCGSDNLLIVHLRMLQVRFLHLNGGMLDAESLFDTANCLLKDGLFIRLVVDEQVAT